MSQQDHITKLNAIALISMATKKSRKYVETKLKDMTNSGQIVMDKTPYSSAILISPEDVDKVIAAIKAESEP